MRKDSELFLRKSLQYKVETGKDAFELDISFFAEIPNIEVEIEDILDELKTQKCISRKSEIVGQTVKIYLTLDGIKYFDAENKKSQAGVTVIIKGKQINVAMGNGTIDAKQYIKKIKNIKNIPKTIAVEDIKKKSSSTAVVEEGKKKSFSASSSSGDEMLWLGVFGVLVLTAIYLDYWLEVQLGIIIASIVIEAITCLVYYQSKKTRVIYGKNIKEMSYFNMCSILCVPILIGVINSPMYISKINLDTFQQSVDKDGIVMFFLNSEYAYYTLFQMIGMLFLALFLLRIICSDIYIIAVTNIVSGRKDKWFWNILFKMSFNRGTNWKEHVTVSLLFLIPSILFVSGIFPYIIDVIIKVNMSNFPI